MGTWWRQKLDEGGAGLMRWLGHWTRVYGGCMARFA